MFCGLFCIISRVEAKQVGDFNNDGKINVFDLLTFLQYLGGKITNSDIGERYSTLKDGVILPIDIKQGITFVKLPEGYFEMGDNGGEDYEKPLHGVFVDSFYISLTEITQAQFFAITGLPYSGDPNMPQKLDNYIYPVYFCNILSKMENLEPCYPDISTPNWTCDYSKNGYRLPTEAEWEYACRAGEKAPWYFGYYPSRIDGYAWSSSNAKYKLQPVAKLLPNSWMLFDLYGNVWELCNDWYSDTYYINCPVSNPKGPALGEARTMRGGDCGTSPGWLTSSMRCASDLFGFDVGFRIVRKAN